MLWGLLDARRLLGLFIARWNSSAFYSSKEFVFKVDSILMNTWDILFNVLWIEWFRHFMYSLIEQYLEIIVENLWHLIHFFNFQIISPFYGLEQEIFNTALIVF